MEPSSSHQASATSRAITIPLHSNSSFSRHMAGQNSRRRNYNAKQPFYPGRADSEADNASSSSLGSDWAYSPVSPPQSTDPLRLGLQVSVASPPLSDRSPFEPIDHPSRRQRKDKQRASSDNLPPDTLPPLFVPSQSPLGPSMISSSAYKSVNLNSHYDPESKEPARLITYTKYAQGFTWNDELFLPSYLLGKHRYRGHGGSHVRRRWAGDDEDDEMAEFEEEGEKCPVTDIFVTDEEAAAMMP